MIEGKEEEDARVIADEKSSNNDDGKKRRKETEEDERIINDTTERTLKNTDTIVNPNGLVGTYVKPGEDWDRLLLDPDVVVIDTRNRYEVEIGTFENAISPDTDNFNQFPQWLQRFSSTCQNVESHGNNSTALTDGQGDEHDATVPCNNAEQPRLPSQCAINSNSISTNYNSPNTRTSNITTNTNARSTKPVPTTSMPIVTKKPKAVAMFCTGGIRCEKATSYALASKLFPPDVPIYHLEGGILSYLDSHPNADEGSRWKGECFVFDQRVALTHGLRSSEAYNSCHGCRRPVRREDKIGEDYLQGVYCSQCKGEMTERQKTRFEERERQMELAQELGHTHIHDPKEIDR